MAWNVSHSIVVLCSSLLSCLRYFSLHYVCASVQYMFRPVSTISDEKYVDDRASEAQNKISGVHFLTIEMYDMHRIQSNVTRSHGCVVLLLHSLIHSVSKWYDEWESTPYIIRGTIVGAAKHSNRENEEKNKGEREKNGWGSFEFQFHSSNTFAAVMIWCWAIQCCLKWSSENPGIRYLHVNYSETMAPQHFQRSMQFTHSLTLTRTHPAAFIFEMAAFTTPPEFRSLLLVLSYHEVTWNINFVF